MSVRVSTLVWERSRATSTAFLLMLALADQANDEGYCWPKRRTLARRLRLKDERGVTRHIRILEELGEVMAIPRFDDNRQISNGYQINLAHLRTLPDLWGEADQPGGGGASARGGVAVAPGGGGSPARGGGGSSARVITVSNNHQLNHQLPVRPALPEWLPAALWGEWEEHLKEAGKTPTSASVTLLFRKLADARQNGHDPVALIETALQRGWHGIVIPTDSPAKGSAGRRPANQAEANERFMAGVEDARAAVKGVFDDGE